MLVTGFPAGPWGTNCFVVADSPGSDCLVIDPGYEAMAQLDAVVEKHRLRVAAVVLTHGHLDHTWSVVPVCKGAEVPAYIHSSDRAMLADPALGMGQDTMRMVEQLTGGRMTFTEPDEVRELGDGVPLDLLGVTLGVHHAPGHTPGSCVFTSDAVDDLPPLLFSGDLLFAGSIGRTDLPGGDSRAMMRSLDRVLAELPDDMVVLPGHGPQTTMAAERATNPFLTGQASL